MKTKKQIITLALAIMALFGVSTSLSAQETAAAGEKKKVTDGRDYLGSFAPKFAEINDDILFGQIWSREKELSARDRSLITVAALMGSGITDQSLRGHLQKAKENGVTKQEMVEVITQLAFYTGWPKGWAVFAQAMEVYKDDVSGSVPSETMFGLGEPNTAYADYFTGKSYVKSFFSPTEKNPMSVDNVTFEPGCRNNWHIHSSEQILLVTDGKGWYQEEGKEPQPLLPGDVVIVRPGVKHWHGAAHDSWFSHLSVGYYTPKDKTDWLEPVPDKKYGELD